ncbi:ATP-binding protein [Paraclostridium sordellii]|uniref:AAA family ATPase n=1 Tax=Paraclostridium sordellii TaxID=1505 RepID=UPI0030CCDB99
MILEFKCSNYKSIKDVAKLSMMATKTKEHEDNILYFKEKGVLPTVAIYGANGAGKTNILKAIGFLNYMVSNSNQFNPGDEIPFFPHKLSNEKQSNFSIQVELNGIRYAYGFSNNKEEILEEYLYHFKNNRPSKIFDRRVEDYTFGADYKKDLKELQLKMSKKNKLFLSIAANWTNNYEIMSIFEYFHRDMVITTFANNEPWKRDSLLMINDSQEYKDAFISLLKALDIGITNVVVDVKQIKVNYDDLPANMPEELKMFISKSENIDIDVKVCYDDLEINLNEESTGVNKLFEIGIPILDVLKNGKVLIYDELETSIHPILVKSIIRLFEDKKINKNNSQLIFTTHDSNLLDLDLLRRDQIWFAEKSRENKSTILYSLIALKNVRNDENIENGYIRGKYGSIPFINLNYLEKINDLKGEIN